MSRKGRRSATGIQLFPFLAVLICTMGALIVLLVLMVQHTTVDAKTKAAAQLAEQQKKSAEEEERLRREREAFEDEQWRAEMLIQQREETAQQLAERRLKLSHLEDHIRRLREQAQALIDRAKEIDSGKSADLEATRAQLEELRRKIAEKQRELDEARQKEPKEQWFALVAYEGPNGTRRRPIYLECTDRGVVLQPEGIVFQPEDFSGPLTAGNPLDSALRATREYLVKAGAHAHGEPYPLLVVRPSGVIAYGAARAAMKSWDQEFGYELVAEDTKLTFGTPDPALQQLLGQTVAVARQKQAIMMAAMPRHYEKGETLTSFAPQDQPEYREAVAAASGRGFGGGAGGSGLGMGAGGGNRPVNPRSGAGRGVSGDTPVRGNLASAGGLAMNGGSGGLPGSGGGGEGNGLGAGTGNGGAGGPALGNPGGNAGGAPGGAPGGPAAAGGAVAGGAMGGPSGMTGGMTSMSVGNSAAAANGAAGAPGQPGQDTGATAAGGSGRNSGQTGAPPAGQVAGGSSARPAGAPPPGSVRSGSHAGGGGSGKGSNWGLPESRIHTTAVTRPIRVVVLRDRILILPEQGEDRPLKTVMISEQLTFAEVDRFVAEIQNHMKSWGIAVANGYWKPILRIEVAPDAEDVFSDLMLGIEDSGFDVQRKVE